MDIWKKRKIKYMEKKNKQRVDGAVSRTIYDRQKNTKDAMVGSVEKMKGERSTQQHCIETYLIQEREKPRKKVTKKT